MGELHSLEMGCEECKKWKEYCFFKVLIADFSKTLTIPRKFALKYLKYLKDLKDEQVMLKGPSGNTWRVKLRSCQGEVFFAEGWTEFLKDHELEEGDFLVFRYAGDSCFRVQAFDMSGCEKEHAHFVGGNPGAAAARGCGGRRKRERSGEAHLHHEEERCSSATLPTKAAVTASNLNFVGGNGRKAAAASTSQHQNVHFITCSIDSEEDEEEEGEDEASAAPSQTCNNYGRRQRMLPWVTMNKQCSSSVLRSTRRPATAAEKQKALSLAKSVKSAGPAFIATMRYSNVYKTFILIIPAKFVQENLPVLDQGMLLRLPGCDFTWPVKYFFRRRVAKFGLGWRQFVVDNGLEEDDACRFEIITSPAASRSSKLMFEVRIFPAVGVEPPRRPRGPRTRRKEISKRRPNVFKIDLLED